MKIDIITAPYINANDLKITVVKWYVGLMDFIKINQSICEIESTKSNISLESEYEGFIYPIVKENETVRVGEPIAYVSDKPEIIDIKEMIKKENINKIITNKAKKLIQKYKLDINTFNNFSKIDSKIVLKKIEEKKLCRENYDERKSIEIIKILYIDEYSVAIYGEKNQSLLAIDAFEYGSKYQPIVTINSHDDTFDIDDGIPTVHRNDLSILKDKGLENLYICGKTILDKKEQIEECEKMGFNFVSAIHPTAHISSRSQINRGVFIGPMVTIGPNVEIGEFSQILCGATIAHHSKIGGFVNISDGTNIGGNVIIEDYCFIGIGAKINKRIKVGRNTIVVSGATVTDNIPEKHIFRLDASIIPKRNLE